jgi:hypothetical protein
LILGAVAAVAVIVVGILVLTRGDDDGGGLDATNAVAVVAQLDDDIEVTDDGGTTLGECPVGRLDDVGDVAPRAFDADEAGAGDIAFVAYRAGRSSDPTSYQCSVFSEDDSSGYGVVVNLAAKGDVHDLIERALPDYDVNFDDDSTLEGGDVVTYCATPDDGDAGGFCESDWVGDGLQVGLFASGEDADEDLVRDWLTVALDDIVGELADADVDDVATTDG